MKYKYIISLLVLLLGLLVFVSCNRTIYIISDKPETALIAEAYNNKIKKNIVIVHSMENIAAHIQNNKIDFIITNPLNSKYKDFFSSTDFKKMNIPAVHIMDTYNDMALLSFSLPLIAIKKDMDEHPYNRKRITLQSLQKINKIYTKKLPSENLYHLGFYPIDTTFYDIFSNAIEEQNWLLESGLASEEINNYYKKHYGPAPIVSRLLNKNIQYKYISSQHFYAMPHNVQDMFNIYLLESTTDKTNIVSPVYMGYISSGIVGHNRIKHFYNWLFSYEGQQEIIALQNKYNPYTVSFIDNSFSSVWETNTEVLFQNNDWLYNNQPLYTQISP